MRSINDTHLGPYAVPSDPSALRRHAEPPQTLLGPFELDRHRILAATAFRRLQKKTQVFAPAYHDHFRTRLTHTLEASHLARILAVNLQANPRLAEAVTLAHDLGHPPFGHAGEAALDEAMASCGGFNHNAHTLRVVEELEHPFPDFHGLNLTIATLTGLATHATRYDKPALPGPPSSDSQQGPDRSRTPEEGDPDGSADPGVPAPPATVPLSPDRPSVESWIASLADRIAYDLHDLEDAIGAEFVDRSTLSDVALWRNAEAAAGGVSPADSVFAIRRTVLDEMLRSLLTDIVETSIPRLRGGIGPTRAHQGTQPPVAPSIAAEDGLAELEAFLRHHLYERPEIVDADREGRRIVVELFRAYQARPERLPERMLARIDNQGRDPVICDYIAGMTDRFCRREHERFTTGSGQG